MKHLKDPKGLLVRLSDERIAHILFRHPDMGPYLNRIGDVVSSPDFIASDPTAPGAVMYVKKFRDLPQLPAIAVVVAKGPDSFVLTAHFARSSYVKRKK